MNPNNPEMNQKLVQIMIVKDAQGVQYLMGLDSTGNVWYVRREIIPDGPLVWVPLVNA